VTVIPAVESLLISISASTSASTATLPIFLPLAIEGSHITAAAAILGYACLGATLGTCTGLVPGFHVNSVAFLLVGIAPTLPGSLSVQLFLQAVLYIHFFLLSPGLFLVSLRRRLHPVFFLDIDLYSMAVGMKQFDYQRLEVQLLWLLQ